MGSAARYDPNTGEHHHVSRIGCHKVVDVEEGAVPRFHCLKPLSKEFEIVDFSLHFRVYCADCLKKSGHLKLTRKRGSSLTRGETGAS